MVGAILTPEVSTTMNQENQEDLVKSRILVVEDDFDVQDLISTVLTREGYEVSVAQTLREVRARFRDLWPDAVLLDAHLPDGCSLEALAEIRDHWPDAALIVATASDFAAEAIERGAFAFLQKPFSLEDLTQTVRRACADKASVALGAGR